MNYAKIYMNEVIMAKLTMTKLEMVKPTRSNKYG